MPNNEDRRVKLTKKILKDALIEIMHEKSIHEISIKKICEVADINRSTFYHHYSSPYELYEDINNDIYEDFAKIKKKNIVHKGDDNSKYMSALLTDILTYVENHRDLFLVLLSDKGDLSIGEKLTNSVLKFVDADNDSELSVYCMQFITAGVANIVWLWLNNENRSSPHDVALMITMIMYHGVRKAFFFAKK